ncbi:ATP-binding protein [Paracoccus zeaxanthinifaciens]|uniref:ATP-binding protein n=1 Tax=Paracoccus zeaxanthinifaciens TaxID=187400 RepID=UPI0004278C99|nr:ATP-binding protein [Paracoccus zeaxanthinifaciens]
MSELASLIDPSKRIGTVTRVTASAVELTLPNALAALGRRGLAKGSVGDFVFVDCDRSAILGRVTEVGIPDRQRNVLEHQIETDPTVEPQGRVQLLATVSKTTRKVTRGINTQPRVGDGVYLAEGGALSNSIKDALEGDVKSDSSPLLVELGHLSGLDDAALSIPPEKLFGRHCGVFGATGGGKSWTVSRLVNEIVRIGGKCILFDPTGEFTGKVADAREFEFSNDQAAEGRLVRFPSERLSELDLNALLRPTGQSQGPTLRSAIISLRMARLLLANPLQFPQHPVEGSDALRIEVQHKQKTVGFIQLDENRTVSKANQHRKPLGRAQLMLADQLATDDCDFDLKVLSNQIGKECLFPANADGTFGGVDPRQVSYNNTLVIRIETLLNSPDMSCFFSRDGLDICAEIEAFLDDQHARALVLSFQNVSFKHNARELLLNALGRYLLGIARQGRFRKNPLVCLLDEAHQFIGRSVGDDQNSVNLDAFGLIAKEGRKYGLSTVVATQRPRDVPQDVLSQLGTLFVHRLTNDRDRETIERACGDLDRSAAAFIPSLSQGEAIIVGPDLPAPLPVMMSKPEKGQRPESHGPNYQAYWGREQNGHLVDE